MIRERTFSTKIGDLRFDTLVVSKTTRNMISEAPSWHPYTTHISLFCVLNRSIIGRLVTTGVPSGVYIVMFC